MRYLSLFSGIESASVAWEPLGWAPVAFAEIDRFACSVLKHRYPHVPNLGDVTKITEADLAALGPVDLVVGGSPCQDLSHAGRRAGLDGERSGLFHEQIRIFRAARSLCGARFLLWENVPGAFSSNGGRDFAVVVGAMAGAEFGVPKRRWQNAGAALGRNGLVEWRCMDAEYVCVESHPFAVPQRRERVFALLDTGDWRSRSPLLLEREGMQGHSPPRREAGQAATRDVAPSLTGSGRGTERVGESRGQDALIPVVTGPLTANGATDKKHGYGMGQQDFENGFAIPIVSPTITANTHRGIDSDCCGQPLIAHALTAEGFDASEDGTGRGTPIVPVEVLTLEIRTRDGGLNLEYRDDGVANALRGSNGGRSGMGAGAIAFSCKDSAADSGPVSLPLRALNHHNSHANAGGQVAVAFAENSRAEVRLCGGDGATAPQLNCGGGKIGQGVPGIATAMSVRRITPLEAERLQGFPDGWTKVPYRGRPAEKCPDGPRYRALGNAMAVNCMRWIGERIEAITQQEST